ncbi:MATE family efflux transporter [Clostridium oryzae]|uniref:Multidrug export protein MepA n=1 Tax=Clostridium oryzae TaxID=1450648 RepID=A0A1V4IQU0_9CLOT|nr:MATE family efflux transporter [Clostridium oryzae]OPJ62388.1 multidrug export protein MepA [Clostridium oryzae]
MNRTEELEKSNVIKLLIKFSIPGIIGMLVTVMYSLVDRIFVGKYVGEMQLSGVGITFPITNIIMAFGMLAGIGAAAVISIKLGQHKKDDAEKVMGNSFILLIIFSLLITIFGLIFLEPILIAFGAGPNTLPYAKEFGTIILLGVIVQNIGFGLNNIIRAEGNPRTAMLTMLIGALINFIANPTLIFIFKLGVRGSALSTVISQTVTTVWTLSYFVGSKSLLKLRKKYFKLDMKVIKEILAIGMSPFAMQLAASLVTVAYNKSLAVYGGELAIGAMTIVNMISMVFLMPIFGINQGAQPIIGYNYGAQNIDRVKKALKYAAIGATVITTLGWIFVELFPTQMFAIFNNDVKLINMGSRGLKIFLAVFPILGFSIVFTNYFQAVAKAKLSMILSLLRQVIVLLPLILILPRYFSLDGVWMAQPISDLISTIITVIFMAVELKKLKEIQNVKTSNNEEERVC